MKPSANHILPAAILRRDDPPAHLFNIPYNSLPED